MSTSPLESIDRVPRDLARALLELPDRDRVQIFEFLRADLEASGLQLVNHQADTLNRQIGRSIEALDRVREHLHLGDEAFLALTMAEYEQLRRELDLGLSAQKIARPFENSWALAKSAAFGGRLPRSQQQRWRRLTLARVASRGHEHLSGVAEWLETSPSDTSAAGYDAWRAERNAELDAQRPYVTAGAIRTKHRMDWEEVLRRARGESDSDDKGEVAELPEVIHADTETPEKALYEEQLIANRLREARTVKGWRQADAARKSGLHPNVISRIEKGEVRAVQAATIVRLARAFGVSTDYFLRREGAACGDSASSPAPE